MAVIFIDKGMDRKLVDLTLKMTNPISSWIVNENITAYKFNKEDISENEVVLARYYTSPRERIEIKKITGHYVSWKSC